MGSEHWYFIKENKLMRHSENDGATFLRHGAEEHESEVPIQKFVDSYQSEKDYDGIVSSLLSKNLIKEDGYIPATGYGDKKLYYKKYTAVSLNEV